MAPFLYFVKRLFPSILVLLVTAGGAGDAGIDEPVEVGLRKTVPGTFYVDGAIGAAGPVEFLVDTGSSYTVINEEMLQVLETAGQATFSRRLEGHMADGSTRIVSLYRIARMRLGPECVVTNVEAAVFPGRTRAILGIDTLARLAPFTFSADPPRLELDGCGRTPAWATATHTAAL
ncbi:MAG TPA: retropepsin-like aspartic protease [Nevskiaceae bacterium]|nr:retropepsin-like aspartic protease [Nevskiaceae bacterium]